jgi:aryl-alcohol dehydrogenase (NADP+)
MIPLCRSTGIGLIPWSPLARGFLSGSRQQGRRDASIREKHDSFGHSLYYAESDYEIAGRVVEVANKRGVLPTQVALAWLLRQPGVVAPIIGATKLTHLEQLAAALEVPLNDEDAHYLEERYQPHRVLGHS